MNYFNYYTEIEERFQQARGSSIFLLSPLDWALIESWKQSDIPLEAVLKGVDRAFEKWHARKRKFQQVNSLAYCSQEVLTAAKEIAEGGGEREAVPVDDTLETTRISEFFKANAEQLDQCAQTAEEPLTSAAKAAAESVRKLAAAADADTLGDLEAVDQRLTILEEKLLAAATQSLSEDDLLASRIRLQKQLAPYRSKMSTEQLALLERQYIHRESFQQAKIPRLSLFFLS